MATRGRPKGSKNKSKESPAAVNVTSTKESLDRTGKLSISIDSNASLAKEAKSQKQIKIHREDAIKKYEQLKRYAAGAVIDDEEGGKRSKDPATDQKVFDLIRLDPADNDTVKAVSKINDIDEIRMLKLQAYTQGFDGMAKMLAAKEKDLTRQLGG